MTMLLVWILLAIATRSQTAVRPTAAGSQSASKTAAVGSQSAVKTAVAGNHSTLRMFTEGSQSAVGRGAEKNQSVVRTATAGSPSVESGGAIDSPSAVKTAVAGSHLVVRTAATGSQLAEILAVRQPTQGPDLFSKFGKISDKPKFSEMKDTFQVKPDNTFILPNLLIPSTTVATEAIVPTNFNRVTPTIQSGVNAIPTIINSKSNDVYEFPTPTPSHNRETKVQLVTDIIHTARVTHVMKTSLPTFIETTKILTHLESNTFSPLGHNLFLRNLPNLNITYHTIHSSITVATPTSSNTQVPPKLHASQNFPHIFSDRNTADATPPGYDQVKSPAYISQVQQTSHTSYATNETQPLILPHTTLYLHPPKLSHKSPPTPSARNTTQSSSNTHSYSTHSVSSINDTTKQTAIMARSKSSLNKTMSFEPQNADYDKVISRIEQVAKNFSARRKIFRFKHLLQSDGKFSDLQVRLS